MDVDELSDSDNDDDIIDRIRTKQKLNASHIMDVLDLFIRAYSTSISLLDPGFVTLYMGEGEGVTKQRDTMMRYFSGDKQRVVTIIPVHHMDHWSLVIHVTLYNTFYYFDSMGEYHNEYIMCMMSKFVSDGIINNLATTRITTIVSECQSHSYECGQYLFMFVYAFLVQYNVVKGILDFDERLQVYVSESCREYHRQSFIRLVIAWIHDSRGF